MTGRGRTHRHPVEHLKTLADIVQADIYAGFNRLYAAGRSSRDRRGCYDNRGKGCSNLTYGSAL